MRRGSRSPSPHSIVHRGLLVALVRDVAETAVEIRQAHGMKLPDAIVWASARRQGRLLVTRDVKNFPAGEPGVRAPYMLKRR